MKLLLSIPAHLVEAMQQQETGLSVTKIVMKTIKDKYGQQQVGEAHDFNKNSSTVGARDGETANN